MFPLHPVRCVFITVVGFKMGNMTISIFNPFSAAIRLILVQQWTGYYASEHYVSFPLLSSFVLHFHYRKEKRNVLRKALQNWALFKDFKVLLVLQDHSAPLMYWRNTTETYFCDNKPDTLLSNVGHTNKKVHGELYFKQATHRLFITGKCFLWEYVRSGPVVYKIYVTAF